MGYEDDKIVEEVKVEKRKPHVEKKCTCNEEIGRDLYCPLHGNKS